MSRIIVPDACALGAAFFNETFTPQADPLLGAIRAKGVDSVAPVICIGEFLNICRKKVEGASGTALPKPIVDRVIQEFLALPILWHSPSLEETAEAWNWYGKGIQTGDAFYLTVASAWGAEVWTIDEPFYSKASPDFSQIHDLRTEPFTVSTS